MKSALVVLAFLFGSAHAAVQTATPSADTTPPPQKSGFESTMSIDAKMRAEDYKEAFEALRKEKTTGKVFFQLQNGTTISNIIDMTLMGNSTLILFRFNSTQGIRFQVVKVEEVAFISYS